MKNPYDCHARSFLTAEQWRKEAEKYEKLAELAKRDGDQHHADLAKRDAANCRQQARLKEVEA